MYDIVLVDGGILWLPHCDTIRARRKLTEPVWTPIPLGLSADEWNARYPVGTRFRAGNDTWQSTERAIMFANELVQKGSNRLNWRVYNVVYPLLVDETSAARLRAERDSGATKPGASPSARTYAGLPDGNHPKFEPTPTRANTARYCPRCNAELTGTTCMAPRCGWPGLWTEPETVTAKKNNYQQDRLPDIRAHLSLSVAYASSPRATEICGGHPGWHEQKAPSLLIRTFDVTDTVQAVPSVVCRRCHRRDCEHVTSGPAP